LFHREKIQKKAKFRSKFSIEAIVGVKDKEKKLDDKERSNSVFERPKKLESYIKQPNKVTSQPISQREKLKDDSSDSPSPPKPKTKESKSVIEVKPTELKSTESKPIESKSTESKSDISKSKEMKPPNKPLPKVPPPMEHPNSISTKDSFIKPPPRDYLPEVQTPSPNQIIKALESIKSSPETPSKNSAQLSKYSQQSDIKPPSPSHLSKIKSPSILSPKNSSPPGHSPPSSRPVSVSAAKFCIICGSSLNSGQCPQCQINRGKFCIHCGSLLVSGLCSKCSGTNDQAVITNRS